MGLTPSLAFRVDAKEGGGLRSLTRLLAICFLAAGGCRTTSLEHWVVGKSELQVGNYDAAIEELQRCTDKDPSFSPAYLALAAAYSRQGDFVAVSANLRQFLRQQPDHDVAHLYLAECSLALGDEPTARDEYLHFIHKAKPAAERHGERLVYCYQRLAELAGRLGDRFEENLYAGLALVEEIRLNRNGIAAAAPDGDISRLIAEARSRLESAREKRPDDPRLSETFDVLEEESKYALELANGPSRPLHSDPIAPRAN